MGFLIWLLDFLTLLLVIAAGIQVGLQGIFGWDAAAHIFGGYEKIAFMVIGLAAVWQLCRQRFF